MIKNRDEARDFLGGLSCYLCLVPIVEQPTAGSDALRVGQVEPREVASTDFTNGNLAALRSGPQPVQGCVRVARLDPDLIHFSVSVRTADRLLHGVALPTATQPFALLEPSMTR